MISDINLSGVFLPALLVWAGLALLLTLLVRTALHRFGFYRWVWHSAVFDIAVFIILLGGVITLASAWAPS